MWGEDLQVDGLPVDALVVARYPRSLCFNFSLDLSEVVVFPARNMMKFSPFSCRCNACWGMRGGVAVFARDIDELQNERSPRDDTAPSG